MPAGAGRTSGWHGSLVRTSPAPFPGYGDEHGFEGEISWVREGRVEVCIYGINIGSGANTLIGCPSMEFAINPFGSLEVLRRTGGGLQVAGWAIDPDTDAPIEVHLYVNGGGHNLGLAATSRPDVAAAYPRYGPDHGFDQTVPVGAGPLDVCVYGINAAEGSNVLFGCWKLT